MYIKLYQINKKRDRNRVCFASFDLLPDLQDSGYVDSSIYDLVWEGELQAADYEEVYAILNNEVPEDYTARALSVSDVIEEIYPGVMGPTSRHLYCDPVGFHPIWFEPEKAGKQKAAPAATGTARK